MHFLIANHIYNELNTQQYQYEALSDININNLPKFNSLGLGVNLNVYFYHIYNLFN